VGGKKRRKRGGEEGEGAGEERAGERNPVGGTRRNSLRNLPLKRRDSPSLNLGIGKKKITQPSSNPVLFRSGPLFRGEPKDQGPINQTQKRGIERRESRNFANLPLVATESTPLEFEGRGKSQLMRVLPRIGGGVDSFGKGQGSYGNRRG